MEYFCPLTVVFLLGIVGFAAFIASQQQAALAEAKKNYDQALAALRNNPGDPNLRKRTLDLGRVYSNLSRNSKGVTIYDEVALSNDIGAACAATVIETSRREVVAPTPPPTPAKVDVVERLRTLNELKSNGLVAEDEFNSLRTALLQHLTAS